MTGDYPAYHSALLYLSTHGIIQQLMADGFVKIVQGRTDIDIPFVRNIGIIAHIDAGKTTTTERVLFYSGVIHKIGDITEGTTQMDTMEQEREKGITIKSAATTTFWDLGGKKYRINIIDTPGHVDFTAEVERSLRVLDGAVVIFDGKVGVQAQSETVWRQADRYNVPRVCFINKIQLAGGDFEHALKTVQKKLDKNAVAIHLPINSGPKHKGFVDIMELQAYEFDELDFHKVDIPGDMQEKVSEYRGRLLEAIVEFDDSLMERYLDGDKLDKPEDIEKLKVAARKATIARKVFLVSGGDSKNDEHSAVVRKILDMVVEYLPSPVDLPPAIATNSDTGEEVECPPDKSSHLSALVFKLNADEHIGNLYYTRVYSGILKAGEYYYNSTLGIKERASRVVLMHADHRTEVPELAAGEVGAIVGLKESATGNTLCEVGNNIVLEDIEFPDPVISSSIEPKKNADLEKLGESLRRLCIEDPTLQMNIDKETSQMIISGMGELHLEITADRLKREFGVETNLGKPQVAYRETVTAEIEVEGKYVHQSGGHGMYGHCNLRVAPLERGKGFEFVDEIKSGAIPKEFIPAVKKGVEEAMLSGKWGYPVTDVRVTLYDGSYHDVDSSEAAFKLAAADAYRRGHQEAKPILLEPIMDLEVTVPVDYLGDLTGFISSRRGQIEETNQEDNLATVTSKLPLSESFGFSSSLRQLSSGRGTFTLEPAYYDRVPANIVEKVAKS